MVSQGKALSRSAQELLADYVATGAQAPFEEIVRRYAGMVFNVCYQILRNSHDAEDATQAVFLALAVQAKTTNGVKYLAPWLQKVAQRLALDVRRSKTRRKAREERHGQMQDQRIGNGHDPTQTTDLDELKVILRDELDRLPAKYRLPLVLHYFGGLKPEEISRELGCKPSTLGVRLHRGRKMLADVLAERGIIVNGSLLAIALAACVQTRIAETLIHSTCTAAASYAAHGTFGTAVGSQVLGFNRLANHGILLAKVKAAVATGILAAAAAAGAAEIVSRVAPIQFKFDFNSEFRERLRPTWKSLWSNPSASADQALSSEAVQLALHKPGVGELDLLNRWTPLPAVQPRGTSDEDASAAGLRRSAPVGTATLTNSARINRDPRDTPYQSVPVAQRASDSDLPAPVVRSAARGVDSTQAASTDIVIHASIDSTPSGSSSGSVGGGGGSGRTPQFAAPAPPPIVVARSPIINAPATPYVTRHGDAIRIAANPGESSDVVFDQTGTVVVKSLTVGEYGHGTLTQAQGTLSAADVTIGEGFRSSGTYVMDGPAAALYANMLGVGADGNGSLKICNDALAIVNRAVIGQNGEGSVEIEGGVFKSRAIYVGLQGSGSITQTSGTARARGLIAEYGALELASSSGSRGNYQLMGGTLEAAHQVIGNQGVAQLEQSGGTNVARTLELGSEETASGTYRLMGGTLILQKAEKNSPIRNKITLGRSGHGQMLLGDHHNPGVVLEKGKGAGSDLTVRAEPGSTGVLQGWGIVRLSGTLNQNGKVIADGFGHPHQLDLTSFSQVINTLENPSDGSNGWYAQRQGQLVLPLNAQCDNDSGLVEQITWGEARNDESLDLVNSARFTFDPAIDPATKIRLSLLASDSDTVPVAPDNLSLVSVYETNFSSLPTRAVRVMMRYDAVSAGDAELRLLAWSEQGWRTLGGDELNIDEAHKLITASLDPADYYAVAVIGSAVTPLFGAAMNPVTITLPAVPEPGALSLFALGAAGLIARRRR